MKSNIKYIIVVLLSSSFLTINAQNTSVQMENNEIVNMTVEEAWSTINNWKELNTLVPKVVRNTEVSGEGIKAEWKINLISGDTISEKMIFYDSNNHTMSYIMTSTPLPITNYRAIIKVEQYGISKALVSFYTYCKTDQKDEKFIIDLFTSFQKTYLSNIDNINHNE